FVGFCRNLGGLRCAGREVDINSSPGSPPHQTCHLPAGEQAIAVDLAIEIKERRRFPRPIDGLATRRHADELRRRRHCRRWCPEVMPKKRYARDYQRG